MEKIQDPRPMQELASTAKVADRIAKINEIVRLMNELLFTDDQIHTE